MPLNIKDTHTGCLARAQKSVLLDDLSAIRERCAALPIRDRRSPDDIIGYDENGLPR